MPRRCTVLSRLTAIVGCALLAAELRGDLIKVSPFMPAQSSANAAAQNAPLQYGGRADYGDRKLYRIVTADPNKKVGTWLTVGSRDAGLGVTLKAAHDDAEPETIEVEYGGQTITLPLKASKILAAAGPVGVPQPVLNVSPAVLNTVKVNPTESDEQRRLDAVAAEVARRRALREQASMQQPTQTSQPTTQTPAQAVGAPRRQ